MAKVSLRAYDREIETMIDRGQLDEAIAHCHHILKIFPKHLDTYRLLGKAYLESKRYGDAADIFLRILASVPNDFVAQVGMSIIRDEENKLDDAIWHMERAFETQPSNSAIQSELQRLYGRRDGVQPPRIRMTRGALAHMYVQGELYPQAISEIRSVLKDDATRADMQALLARATFKSGAKNEAADVASALLRRYPYSLDANRVLAEILGAERPENAQLYRQRVVELDPYAAQVTGTMFQSSEVPEAAVSIEQLDWNGQPVSMQSDWSESKAITLESGMEPEEQPDWLKGAMSSMTPPLSQPTPASIFDTSATPLSAPAQPAEEIPDFMKAAGWGQSTGAFDESKSAFADDEPAATDAQPIEQADLPDWVKAMKPSEPEAAAQGQEEELPDWINNIDKGVLSSQASTQPDWLGQPEQSASQASDQFDWLNQSPQNAEPVSAATEDQPDWLKNFDETQQPAQANADQSDWLQDFGSQTESTSAAASADEPDWLKGMSSESDFAPQPAQTETPDWLKGLESEPETASAEAQPDWMQQPNAETETPATEQTSGDFDFLNQLSEEPVLQTPETPSSTVDVDKLGVSEQERDDSFAWLESLAAKQGASEGLLTKPEERREEEPEWVKQAKGLSSVPPTTPAEQFFNESSSNLEDLGKSEQEQDDSFAWLENLAAKQGATEGLLTQPEERLEQEPEWVRQAKDLSTQPPPTPIASEPEPAPAQEQPSAVDEVEEWLQNLEGERRPEPAADETAMWLKSLDEEETAPTQPTTPPVANLEDLGKSEQERDDSFAWLESLAAKQGASEGLLTNPEERREEEPEWVRQAKDLNVQPPIGTTPEPTAQEPTSMDDTAAWLQSLEEETPATQSFAADQTAMWLKKLDEEEPAPETGQTAESAQADLPVWMQNIEQEESVTTEFTVPVEETQAEPQEQTTAEEPTIMNEAKPEEEGIPSWLAELDQEEEKPVSAAVDDDLPAWLRAEETAPEAAEPTRASDWQPAEKPPEIIYSPPLEEPKEPEIIYSPPLEETPAEPVAFESKEESFELPEELRVEPLREEPQPEPVSSAASTMPEPEQETHRVPAVMMPHVDPVLGSARNELSRNNVASSLESYGRLIKKGRFLEEVIYDLKEAVYRYPVDVNIWQSLGDAYMRANRLQDALDAYTKAEELLR